MKLVKPLSIHQTDFFDFVDDFNRHGEHGKPSYFQKGQSYTEYLDVLKSLEKGNGDIPPTEFFFLLNDCDEIVGTIRFRNKLNEFTEIDGGHVGFDIAPSRRRQGYGKEILKLLIDKLAQSNFPKILVTVETDNPGSIKIIEKNGGILENEMISLRTNKLVKRYWIKILEKDK